MSVFVNENVVRFDVTVEEFSIKEGVIKNIQTDEYSQGYGLPQ